MKIKAFAIGKGRIMDVLRPGGQTEPFILICQPRENINMLLHTYL